METSETLIVDTINNNQPIEFEGEVTNKDVTGKCQAYMLSRNFDNIWGNYIYYPQYSAVILIVNNNKYQIKYDDEASSIVLHASTERIMASALLWFYGDEQARDNFLKDKLLEYFYIDQDDLEEIVQIFIEQHPILSISGVIPYPDYSYKGKVEYMYGGYKIIVSQRDEINRINFFLDTEKNHKTLLDKLDLHTSVFFNEKTDHIANDFVKNILMEKGVDIQRTFSKFEKGVIYVGGSFIAITYILQVILFVGVVLFIIGYIGFLIFGV